jgi:predicted ATPase/DNA-binding winged helix-turn-helix (wHTH) protein
MTTFAGLTLDVEARLLTRGGQVTPLEPQAFDVLALLVAERHRVVPKEEILDSVWGDRWVSESALTTRIKEIRRAVGDTGETQAVIRTVRGKGYQFVAPVDAAAAGEAAATPGLVGRDRDFDAIAQRLLPGALVTLVGPGGVGKTTLGRSLAAHLHGSFRDGCFPIDLTVVRDRDELFAVVARALQIVDASSDTLPALLRTFQALLLLDDADELVSEVAGLCEAISGDGSRVTLLVTCRERLGASGEQIWPVLPLGSDDAVELLQTRAAQLAPFGALMGSDTSEMVELTALVDNLPLAIEMLASGSAHLGRHELAELVSSAPETLTDPRRNAPARHKSLDVLVTASIARLEAPEATALEAISTFAGPFHLADAAAVCGLGSAGLPVVRDLVDCSLLAPSISDGQGPRFQMLRTVTRAVRKRLDDKTRQHYEQQHAAWVAAELAAADRLLRSEDERAGSERFACLADDARVAHAWAREHDVELALAMTASLHLYAHSRLWAEPAQWAEAIPDWRHHGRALAAAASQASQEARFDDTADLGRIALADDDPVVQAWALEALSDIEIYRGELEAAISHSGELVALGLRCADTRMIALGSTNGVLARAYNGDPEGAIEHWDLYPWDGPRSSAPTDRGWLTYARGEALDEGGQAEAAVEQLELAAQLADSVDSRFVAGVARSSLGSIQRRSGNLRASTSTHRDLIATFSRHGIATHLAITLRNTVPLLVALGREREASVLCGWLLGPNGRSGYGANLDMVTAARNQLRASHPAAASDWEHLGAPLSVFELATFTLAALDEASVATSPG